MAGELLVTRCDFLGNKMKLLIRLMFHSDLCTAHRGLDMSKRLEQQPQSWALIYTS